MNIAICPSDNQAVGYYRLGLPAITLHQQAEPIETTFLPGLPLNTDQHGNIVSLAHEHFPYDALILQRPTQPWQVTGMRHAQAAGIPVIVELDDNLHRIDPHNVAARTFTPAHLHNLDECCKAADLVTVSTPALVKRYAPHGRYIILPNYIPAAWCDITAHRDGNVIGWTGTVASHPNDLQATGGAVARTIRRTHARFRVIGHPQRVRHNLQLDSEPEHVAWQSREQYPHEVARFDIGIAPLSRSEFNDCKSWLKPLEHAALGVPTVMSPTAEYKRLHNYGIGVIAKQRPDWQSHLTQLLTDNTYRSELAAQGREAVRQHLTIEANAWRYAEAWTSVKTRNTERV